MPPAYLRAPGQVEAENPAWRRGCTGKMKYATGGAASRAGAATKSRHVYLCRYCGGWHHSSRALTAMERRQGKPRVEG